ncbi:MAG: hypothetical protein ACSHW1_01730 [Yoonia sp.]|uniref:hypothetical protein n=1 Tax=Yoonia sp. TaxID=2212373 RepID=UPI003EF683FC
MKRTKSDRALWHRLEGYSFHERPLRRSLVECLRDATGHSEDVCYTLVEEYRRFMYLVGSTGDDLVPSPIVDVVWRLHSADTNAYFDDFCRRIIGRKIHRPEAEPAGPLPFHDDPAYARTLELYAQEFGSPQVQYWPDPDVAAMRMSRILFWIIGAAALILSVVFQSVLFVVFGLAVCCMTFFLQWKFSSLPLQHTRSERVSNDGPV